MKTRAQSRGQQLVRVNQVERALTDIRDQAHEQWSNGLARYHEEIVVPILARQKAPWFLLLWYDYLRPLLALYGFVP